jgi:hypothetical protein
VASDRDEGGGVKRRYRALGLAAGLIVTALNLR